jgi:hypothetical protein
LSHSEALDISPVRGLPQNCAAIARRISIERRSWSTQCRSKPVNIAQPLLVAGARLTMSDRDAKGDLHRDDVLRDIHAEY